MFTFSSLVLLEMVQEVLMTLEQTDLFPLHMCQTRTQITPTLEKLYCTVLSANMVTVLNRLQAWLVVGLKLGFLGELSSRTYFMISMCEHTYYSRLSQKVNCTHLFKTAI